MDQLSSSFRDPSGFLFLRDGVLFRQVSQPYAEDYAYLMSSGLYEKLVKAGLLIAHSETDLAGPEPSRPAFKVIQPELVPFISYPYEWSFSQLRDAALATLSIEKRALKAGLSLKDASAYNIQFVGGKPTLIDTLSFEIYREGKPWDAYRQFCQHFLAPLALMSYVDIRLSQLLRIYIDGVPLDLTSRLLPQRTRLNFGLLTHLHLHARAQMHYAESVIKNRSNPPMNRTAFLALVESLESTVKKLTWKLAQTEWANYYDITNYSSAAFERKKELVSQWILESKPSRVWDLGANRGIFSRLASEQGICTVAWDIDPVAVEQSYLQVKASKEKNLLPLLQDLTNPSPALGWDNRERSSFGDRGPADLVLALALIHHLAISNNVPLPQLADFFADAGKNLIIEFIPKTDSQVQKLLRSRTDIFGDYTVDRFEAAFSKRFHIREQAAIPESDRVLYWMEAC